MFDIEHIVLINIYVNNHSPVVRRNAQNLVIHDVIGHIRQVAKIQYISVICITIEMLYSDFARHHDSVQIWNFQVGHLPSLTLQVHYTPACYICQQKIKSLVIQ